MAHVRPDPDLLLQQLQQDEIRARKGKLKIFFGACAGVGKTYAMLTAAHEAMRSGHALIVGLIETHGRRDTADMLEGLPQLARREIAYQGHNLSEFDLDAALALGARHSQQGQTLLVLVDELAHSNVSPSRHPKRWQDVHELLAAGIDVWTTLNVQHLESLNDVVSGITGVRVQETVPDHVFDEADAVVVLDLPPSDLLARLSAGKVYPAAQAARASQHFFRQGNLIALREMALRRTADRVDEQMLDWRRSTDAQAGEGEPPVWVTREALLAAVNAHVSAAAVVRRAARLATRLQVPWHVVFVDVPALGIDERARATILRVLRLAQELGAITATLPESDVAQALVRYARQHNLTRILLARPLRPWPWGDKLAARLWQLAPEIEQTQVAALSLQPLRWPLKLFQDEHTSWQGYAVAVLACMVLTGLGTLWINTLGLTNIVMLYMLTAVLLAWHYGRRPATLAAVLGVLLCDFVFVPPRYSLAVSDVLYVITFAVMLIVTLLISHLTASLKNQAQAAAERERRMQRLYAMARDLGAALQPEQVADIAAHFLQQEFAVPSVLLLSNARAAEAIALEPVVRSMRVEFDEALAEWVFSHGESAGVGTHTLPASPYLMLPLQAPMRCRGVLVLACAGLPPLSVEQRQALDTCASLLAIAVERLHYVAVAQSSLLQMESEKLRNTLLAAISHDLRTPLAGIGGMAQTLVLTPPGLNSLQRELVQAITDSALRMNALVNNLLDMAKLQAGEAHLRRQLEPLEEVLGSAIQSSATALKTRTVRTELAPDLPWINLDALLFERVLVNLLENAAKYTPEDSVIQIFARVQDQHAVITVQDRGVGLPVGQEQSVFEKFARGHSASQTPGVGLGLALCRAIVQAHGGRIWAENWFTAQVPQQAAGARFIIELPLAPTFAPILTISQ